MSYHCPTPKNLLQQSQSSMPRSKETSEQQENPSTMSPGEILDSIEQQMREIESKLKAVKQQKQQVRQGSSECAQLEEERKMLKKQLIDLDYHHQRHYELIRNGNGSKQLSGHSRKEEMATEPQERGGLEEIKEIDEKVESQYLDYSRRVQDQLEKIQEASRAREEELRNIFKSDFERKDQKKEFSPYQEKTEDQIDRGLDQARQRSRIADLQLTLATDALRRSRQHEIQAEISAIRLMEDHSWPRASYMPAAALSYLDPLDPLFLAADPYLYPYY